MWGGHQSIGKYLHNLEGMVDFASEVLACPITVEDESHRLIAYSKHKPETDPARIATIIGRKVPDEVIQALWREGIIQKLMVSKEPIRVLSIDEVGLRDRIAFAIRHEDQLLGYIWLIDTQQLDYEHIANYLTGLATRLGTKLMMERNDQRNQEQHMQVLFWRMLRNEIPSDTQIRDEALQIGVELPYRYQIKVLEFNDHDPIYDLDYAPVKAWSNDRVRIVMHVAYQRKLILLCAASERTGLMPADWEQFLHQLNHRFKVVPERYGGGLSFDRYDLVSASYQEALTVLQMKQRYPKAMLNCHQYEDLGYYRYLGDMQLLQKKHPCEQLCVTKLREYDDQHHTNLLQTLYIYLAEDCNVKQAADQLHVHTNTLIYRMKRVFEIGDMNLTNMEVKLTLYLELKLYSWETYPHWTGSTLL